MDRIQTFDISENGFFPCLITKQWQLAILNFLPSQKLENIDKLEVHNNTDEVFLLQQGNAFLITAEKEKDVFSQIQVQPMKEGVVYNVLRGCWHNVVMSEDAKIFIVENSNTHENDVTYFHLREKEKTELKMLFKKYTMQG